MSEQHEDDAERHLHAELEHPHRVRKAGRARRRVGSARERIGHEERQARLREELHGADHARPGGHHHADHLDGEDGRDHQRLEPEPEGGREQPEGEPVHAPVDGGEHEESEGFPAGPEMKRRDERVEHRRRAVRKARRERLEDRGGELHRAVAQEERERHREAQHEEAQGDEHRRVPREIRVAPRRGAAEQPQRDDPENADREPVDDPFDHDGRERAAAAQGRSSPARRRPRDEQRPGEFAEAERKHHQEHEPDGTRRIEPLEPHVPERLEQDAPAHRAHDVDAEQDGGVAEHPPRIRGRDRAADGVQVGVAQREPHQHRAHRERQHDTHGELQESHPGGPA